MQFVWGIIFFFLGTAVGSFLNVVIIRGSRNERLGGRSYCESCKIRLKWKELIPVFSFLLQQGRCRRCRVALSQQYIWVEFGMGLIFLIPFILSPTKIFDFGYLWKLVAIWIISAAVLVIFVSDLRYKIIPNKAVALILAAGVARTWSQAGLALKNTLPDVTSALILAIFLGLLWLISKGAWMGLGDVKLILATSLLLGYPASLSAFLFSFWLGGAAGLFLLALQKSGLKSQIPFGPFIITGSVLAYFWSQPFLYKTGLLYFI